MKTLALLSLAILSFNATAGVLGCYKRNYSAAHLAKNPKQKVQSIKLTVYEYYGSLGAIIDATSRRPISGVQNFTAGGGCLNSTVTPTHGIKHDCGIDADGGNYSIEISGDGSKAILRVKEYGIRLEEPSTDEPSEISLALEAGSTNGVYILNKVSNSECPFDVSE